MGWFLFLNYCSVAAIFIEARNVITCYQFVKCTLRTVKRFCSICKCVRRIDEETQTFDISQYIGV